MTLEDPVMGDDLTYHAQASYGGSVRQVNARVGLPVFHKIAVVTSLIAVNNSSFQLAREFGRNLTEAQTIFDRLSVLSLTRSGPVPRFVVSLLTFVRETR